MKKLLLFIFSILISFNSYGLVDKTICNRAALDPIVKDEESSVYRQISQWSGKDGIFGIFYNPSDGIKSVHNNLKPYTGKNLCQHINGRKSEEGDYKDGKLIGLWTNWHNNGQKRKQTYYKDGVLVSKTLYRYYDNGNIESIKRYKYGRLNGKSTFWYENGQKLLDGNYKDNKADGKWTFWKENGNKDEDRDYRDGVLVNKTIFKYSYFTGHLKSDKK